MKVYVTRVSSSCNIICNEIISKFFVPYNRSSEFFMNFQSEYKKANDDPYVFFVIHNFKPYKLGADIVIVKIYYFRQIQIFRV